MVFLEGFDKRLAEINDRSAVFDLGVRVFRIYRSGNVGGECPRCGGPYKKVFAVVSFIDERELQVRAFVSDLLITLGDDLVLGQAGSTARAPWHDISALVDPSFVGAGLQEMPDGVVILVRLRVIRVVPVHEVAKTF